MVDQETLRLAKLVWDYSQLHQKPGPSDVIVAMGCQDLRVADRAAELYLEGSAPVLVCTGAHGGRTRAKFGLPKLPTTEADAFRSRAIQKGVPAEAVLVENRAVNTGQNISFTRELLQEKGVSHKRLLFVHKPYMERRLAAAIKRQWPEVEAIVTSPQISFENYTNDDSPFEYVVNVMVGDQQRLTLYAQQGLQTSEDIPEEVRRAYERLVALGYDKRLADR